MAFNNVGQYTGNHKTWDHVGNILPNVEYSEGVRPHLEGRPAEWLPVQFFDKHYENWFVIMPGKVVAFDGDGKLVPAGLKIAAELAGTGDVVTYTQNDVDAGVINVATGLPVTTAELTDSGPSRGYTAAEIDAAGFLGVSGVALSISAPVGVAPYAYLQWAGGDGFNPVDYSKHNYNMQHQVAIVCDYVMEMPLIPAEEATESVTFSSPTSNISTGTLANTPVAVNTQRTEIVFAGGASATLFVNEKTTAAGVVASGDWHVDTRTGLITVYASSQPTSITVTYSHYASAPATVSAFASAIGNLKGGDLVTFDANSNYRIASQANLYLANDPTGAEVARAQGLIVGQVLERQSGVKDALDKVRTSYNPAINTSSTGSKPAYLGQLDQMPGSATGGATANVHYAGGADTKVTINLTRF
jgi:hypothetical protein